jgi:flagellar assembly factor FliW
MREDPMLSTLNEQIIDLGTSMLGFSNLKQYILKVVEEGSPYAFLHSIEDENIGFLVASPFDFFTDFAFELSETTMKELKIVTPEDVLVLGIITLSDPFDKSTMNLLAPIVISLKNLGGRQIILPTKYNYSTKTPLYKEISIGEAES